MCKNVLEFLEISVFLSTFITSCLQHEMQCTWGCVHSCMHVYMNTLTLCFTPHPPHPMVVVSITAPPTPPDALIVSINNLLVEAILGQLKKNLVFSSKYEKA